MPMTVKADEQGRISCAELFPPNATFEASTEPDGSIRLTKVPPEDVPVVQPIRSKEGFLMLPVDLDSKVIARAIRMDRDAS